MTRERAADLLARLIRCDTSNPPGNETAAALVLGDFLDEAGVNCELLARDPARANLVARVRGTGAGPSLGFLTHLDVVPARAARWTVDPFGGGRRDGAVWGRGAVDMKCQVAAVAVALTELVREPPPGDVVLIAAADEEDGSAEVGTPWLVREHPDLVRTEFAIGEGAGDRIPAPDGPLYLLDACVKASAAATVRIRGTSGDASLRANGESPLPSLADLLRRLHDHRPEIRIEPEVAQLLDGLAPGRPRDEQIARVRSLHAYLDRLMDGLLTTTIVPTRVEAATRKNVVPDEVELTLYCAVLPAAVDEVEREIRRALGDGGYELELEEPVGGSRSPLGTPLHGAIERFLAQHDPEARLLPTMAYGFSDCHWLREAFGTITYGFVPFRHADPLVNMTTKHGEDERVPEADLEFQTLAARALPWLLAAAV